jgi:primase-polymerase (primpol)-like protein
MSFNINGVPYELRAPPFWGLWKREGDRGKIPHNPRTGGRARANDPTTFTDFQTAYKVYMRGGYDGLGICIVGNIAAIDIDHCVVDGALSDMAAEIIRRMDSYTEYSPSGHGIRIIFTVTEFQYDTEQFYIHNQKLGIEVYVSGATSKFVTVTGNRINDNNYAFVADSTLELKNVLNMYMRRNTRW